MEKRNFEMYKTRREAFLAYRQLEENRKTPIWAYDDDIPCDDIPCAVVVDFHDWCWLPVREDSMYSVKQYCKAYLGRDYP